MKRFLVASIWVAAVAMAAPAFQVKVTGEGPTVVLIPGLGSSGEVWDATVEHLKAHHQCHVLTLAGFAGNPAISGELLPQVREQLSAYLRDRHLGRATLIGHSLGGYLAFDFAIAHPEQVERVIAVDGVPYYSALFDPTATPMGWRPRAEAIAERIRSQSHDAFAAQARAGATVLVTAPADVDRVSAWTAASDPAAIANAMLTVMTSDLRSRVRWIQAPVLLIAATNGQPDPAAVRAHYEDQVSSIPHHQTVAIEARHFVMYDAPQKWLSTMDAFLSCPDAGCPLVATTRGTR